MKFNEVGDAFFFDIAKGKSEKENLNSIKTETISLFDPHIPVATLHGAQFHFHAPSEHSIDGQLLDLEMHIVHFMEEKHDPWNCDRCESKGLLRELYPGPFAREARIISQVQTAGATENILAHGHG